MGLDMYAYARPPRKRNSDNDIQIGEWRKHNRLQGWMQQLWESKGCPNAHQDSDEFNSVEMELTEEDINALEDDILTMSLPESNGFFWGSDSFFWTDEEGNDYPENSYYYLERDLEFVTDARKMLDKKHRTFYSCWY
jgi:hypothetical protein